MKHPSFTVVRIESQCAEVWAAPGLAVVEKLRKIIKKSGMSSGIYSKLQVTME